MNFTKAECVILIAALENYIEVLEKDYQTTKVKTLRLVIEDMRKDVSRVWERIDTYQQGEGLCATES